MIKKFNPRKVFSYALLSAIFVLIVVLTWVPLIFDPEHIDTHKWLTNSLISVGIMISAIIVGEIIGEDKQKENVKGLYQQNLTNYNNTLGRLKEAKIIVYFSQFFIWFKARELKAKKEGHLVDHGFDQMVAHLIVKYIERDDIEQMRAGVFVKKIEGRDKEIKFKKISEEEYNVLLEIFSPDFMIDAPKYTYYLSAFADSSSVSTLEQAKKIEAKERLNKTFNRGFKIALSLFISFIWGMATIKDLTENGVNEAIINTVFRLLALVGGLLSGVLTSIQAVKLMAQKLDNKTQVLEAMEIHYDKKEFVPKSYDELVEEEIKQEEEDKAKVVTPEVVVETKPMITNAMSETVEMDGQQQIVIRQ